MLRYGPIAVDPPIVLAPMAGITDRQFRLVLRRLGGVGLVTMEFISSEALVRKNKRARKLMQFAEEERPISIQIYGRQASHMAEAARIVEEIGADICDINMGCPANKILKGCSGCALMGDLDLARDIVRTVRRAISIPLSVKFRLDSTTIGELLELAGSALKGRRRRDARAPRSDVRAAPLERDARLKRARDPAVETATSLPRKMRSACSTRTGCDGGRDRPRIDEEP